MLKGKEEYPREKIFKFSVKKNKYYIEEVQNRGSHKAGSTNNIESIFTKRRIQ